MIDSTEGDPETHTPVWQWLDSAMELVVGDSHEEGPAAASRYGAERRAGKEEEKVG